MPSTATASPAPCTRCNGTGNWVNPRNSADVRPCFSCQPGASAGAYSWRRNNRRFAAPAATNLVNPVAPAMNGADGAAPVLRPATGLPRGIAAWDAFKVAHPTEHGWIQGACAAGNDFALSLQRGIFRYGNLTPRQLAAVQRNLPTVAYAPDSAAARDAGHAAGAAGMVDAQESAAAPRETAAEHMQRASELFAATRAARVTTPDAAITDTPDAMAAAGFEGESATVAAAVIPTPAPAPRPVEAVRVDVGAILPAMDAARASGLRKVRLTLGSVEFRLSGPNFRYGANVLLAYFRGTYAGWINREGAFTSSRRLSPSLESEALDAFRTAAANPQAAARTHGHDTGHCSCCRRLLTDPVSVMAGIGPVCAERFGWSF